MRIEQDAVELLAGVRFGETLGSPLGLLVRNRDWDNWTERMTPHPGGPDPRPVQVPRPGHTDLAGALKYGRTADLRDILERASARETAMRVALGAAARALLRELGIQVGSYVRSIGTAEADAAPDVEPGSVPRRRRGAGAARRPHRDPRPDPGRLRPAGGGHPRGAAAAGHRGRRHRGHRHRRAAGARLARPVGPQARWATRRGAALHPGHQGGGDGRRLPRWPGVRQRGPRPDDPRRGPAGPDLEPRRRAWRAASPTASRSSSGR